MKLCEVIALTTQRKPESQKQLTELHQMTQKVNLFAGLHKTYQARDENDTETLPEERVAIQARVKNVLDVLAKNQANVYDLVLTQDVGNTVASADIVVDGKTIVQNVPVTTLLYLEKQCEDLRKFYTTLPVIDVAKDWTYDDANRCYRSVTKKTRTKRKKMPLELSPATDKHPAQVTLIEEDVIVGDYTNVETSGAMTANDKAIILERLLKFKDAVVVAREKANQATVEQQRFGDNLFKYLHSGL